MLLTTATANGINSHHACIAEIEAKQTMRACEKKTLELIALMQEVGINSEEFHTIFFAASCDDWKKRSQALALLICKGIPQAPLQNDLEPLDRLAKEIMGLLLPKNENSDEFLEKLMSYLEEERQLQERYKCHEVFKKALLAEIARTDELARGKSGVFSEELQRQIDLLHVARTKCAGITTSDSILLASDIDDFMKKCPLAETPSLKEGHIKAIYQQSYKLLKQANHLLHGL